MSGDINKAQAILKKQHSDIGGLFCCTIGGSLEFPRAQGDQWLQIIHDGSDHKKVTPSPCSVNGFCKLTPFPSFPSRATKTHETFEAEFLYCPCRRKGLEKKGLEFIGFDAYGCNKWFHKMCFNNCPKDMQDK